MIVLFFYKLHVGQNDRNMENCRNFILSFSENFLEQNPVSTIREQVPRNLTLLAMNGPSLSSANLLVPTRESLMEQRSNGSRLTAHGSRLTAHGSRLGGWLALLFVQLV